MNFQSTIKIQPAVTISLFREIGYETWIVERVAYALSRSKASINFTNLENLDDVFTNDFCAAVSSYLPQELGACIMFDGETVFSCPSLVLGGLRMIAIEPIGGRQRVSLRFQSAFGELQSFLLPQHRSEKFSTDMLDRLAVSAISDILGPCLDLLELDVETLSDTGDLAPIKRVLEQLRVRKSDMMFYWTLIGRFLSNSPLEARQKANPSHPRYHEPVVHGSDKKLIAR